MEGNRWFWGFFPHGWEMPYFSRWVFKAHQTRWVRLSLKRRSSFNPWVSQSYSQWFLRATFRSRLASILLSASGALRITLSLQSCAAKSPDFSVSLSTFVLGGMDRLITYIGFPAWWDLPASGGDKRNLLQIWTNRCFLRSVSKNSCLESRVPC